MHVLVTCKYKKNQIKNKWEKVETSFPYHKSMGAFCCHRNQSFQPICPKTLCNLFPTLMMLHIKFDQHWPTGLRDIQVSSELWQNDRIPEGQGKSNIAPLFQSGAIIKGQISSSSLIPVYMIHLPNVHVCTKFQSSRPHSSRGKCDQKFQCWKLERKKNEEIMRWRSSSSSLIPVYMIHLSTVYVCTKFQSSRPHSSWEKSDEKFQCWKLERKKNEEIKGRIRCSSLILVNMIHLSTVHACIPIFNLLGLIVPEKSDKKILC